MTRVIARVNLENVHYERGQTQKTTYCMILVMGHVKCPEQEHL